MATSQTFMTESNPFEEQVLSFAVFQLSCGLNLEVFIKWPNLKTAAGLVSRRIPRSCRIHRRSPSNAGDHRAGMRSWFLRDGFCNLYDRLYIQIQHHRPLDAPFRSPLLVVKGLGSVFVFIESVTTVFSVLPGPG
jgi:hypothetical protein